MCVFNFFIRKSWLAGEGDYLLRTPKLKVGFCGISDTRRAFSRACIAKSAYHKPSLSRRMGAALPLHPCGSRRRPSRRGPQRPWGHRAGRRGLQASEGKAGAGPPLFQNMLSLKRRVQNAARMIVRGPPFRDSEIRDQVRGAKARMRSILSNKLASSGPRWRWTALRAD